MTENPTGKGSKMGLGTDLSKVSGMSKDASGASLRRYPVLSELRRLIREFARATFRTYLSVLLAASPMPIACKLHSFIDAFFFVCVKRSRCVDQCFIFSAFACSSDFCMKEKRSLSRIMFSNFKEVSPFDVQVRVKKKEASAKVYLRGMRRLCFRNASQKCHVKN